MLTALELSFVGSFMGHRYYNLKHAVIFNVTIEAEDCIEHCYRNKYRYASIQVSVQIFQQRILKLPELIYIGNI